MQWEKENLINKWCLENRTATCRRMKLDHFLTTHTQINLKWVKDPNVLPETMKILKYSTGSNFSDIGHSKIFLDNSLEAHKIKAKIIDWDYINIKSFCTANNQ